MANDETRITFPPNGYVTFRDAVHTAATVDITHDPEVAEYAIRNLCYGGAMEGVAFTEAGKLKPIPEKVWGTGEFKNICATGKVYFATELFSSPTIAGRVLFHESDIARLAGRRRPSPRVIRKTLYQVLDLLSSNEVKEATGSSVEDLYRIADSNDDEELTIEDAVGLDRALEAKHGFALFVGIFPNYPHPIVEQDDEANEASDELGPSVSTNETPPADKDAAGTPRGSANSTSNKRSSRGGGPKPGGVKELTRLLNDILAREFDDDLAAFSNAEKSDIMKRINRRLEVMPPEDRVRYAKIPKGRTQLEKRITEFTNEKRKARDSDA